MKKRQPLVKKQMDPVISTEDMDNASTAEGLSTFSTYSFLVLS